MSTLTASLMTAGLASDDYLFLGRAPRDAFWRKYAALLKSFSETPLAEEGIDTEVLSVIVLAGTFLWPVWARAGSLDQAGRKASAERFSRELLRLSARGTMADQQPAPALS